MIVVNDERIKAILARLGAGDSVPLADASEAYRAVQKVVFDSLPPLTLRPWNPLDPFETEKKASRV